MNKQRFEDVLARDGRLIYSHEGDSMEPLLQPRDLLIIKPVTGRLQKGDIPLYRRDSGQVVLHRIVDIRRDGYVMCGDNRTEPEFGITDQHIIGKLDGIIRNGKTLTVEEAEQQGQMKLAEDYDLPQSINGTAQHAWLRKTKRNLDGDDSSRAKRRYLVRRFFLSGEALKENYPFFYRHKALYPLLLVYRPVKGLIKRPRALLFEVKQLKAYHNKK